MSLVSAAWLVLKMNHMDWRSTGLKAAVTPDATTGECKGLPEAQQGDKDDEFAEVLSLLASLSPSKFEMLARSLHFDSPAAVRDFFCINPHLFHVSLISHEAKDEEFRERKRLRLSQQHEEFEEFARSLHFDSPEAACAFFCINPHLHYDACRPPKRPRQGRTIGEKEEAADAKDDADAKTSFQSSMIGSRSPVDAVAKASAEKGAADVKPQVITSPPTSSLPKSAITASCNSVRSLASCVLSVIDQAYISGNFCVRADAGRVD